jgi:hypothetical protein
MLVDETERRKDKMKRRRNEKSDLSYGPGRE